ncbi:SRPBCC family protein [Phenylobacterium sp. LjRoot219]|uniref:SRPBCC family protein n=1 Tax=Phenylobacterium sp. LjRoot219 TaxID=3342283 RepID=UPI003ED0CF5F
MTQRSVTHATFTLERSYPHPVQRVFDAFATPEGKARWFGGSDGELTILEQAFDFREGGEERLAGRWHSGRVSDFQARYLDILPGERIVYVYEMRIDGVKISASLASLEFKATAGGTQLKVTEQGAFLDGYDDAGGREHGTAELLDRLGASLETAAA